MRLDGACPVYGAGSLRSERLPETLGGHCETRRVWQQDRNVQHPPPLDTILSQFHPPRLLP
jgi:hypothetical protein